MAPGSSAKKEDLRFGIVIKTSVKNKIIRQKPTRVRTLIISSAISERIGTCRKLHKYIWLPKTKIKRTAMISTAKSSV